ncbi:hypothetical protein OZN62_08855 [Aurantiacibacter sp. MUD11]|uniref:hypothetical protein n=1 Tax=Aurantiacibacter sp. MUD11 TaxID=3003265 RepID=UPI0022AAD00E|nr:hypothetical protein [Aurantiacibacter sp. MUD11]WAT17047.1 hypothetical protein OZN62_08855 [Aurantiacibacter sp. MUD11]
MSKLRKGLAGKVALGASAALLAVAVPGTGLAFVSLDGGAATETDSTFIAFTPADADPRLARFLAERGSDARMMRFTPAGVAASQAARSITVAVRVDPETADALAARSVIDGSRKNAPASALRVTPTRYNLGLARGYSSFAQAPAAAAPASSRLSRTIARTEMPDLADFTPSRGAQQEPSRFAARIALDEDRTADNAAVSGERLTDQMLDVTGSYSLTRNLDITAGIRYEQDRDLLPVPNIDQQDSQAVYIGTQFRF